MLSSGAALGEVEDSGPDLDAHAWLADEHEEDEETLEAVDDVEHEDLGPAVGLTPPPADDGAHDLRHPCQPHHQEQLRDNDQHRPGAYHELILSLSRFSNHSQIEP